jgi:hypothetical protein
LAEEVTLLHTNNREQLNMKFIIWNPEKTDGATNLEELRGFEATVDESVSSEITAKNEQHLQELLEAFYNETDATLRYAEKRLKESKSTVNKLFLTMPSGCIIAHDVDCIKAAGERIRAAFDFADGIELDWADIQECDSDNSICI